MFFFRKNGGAFCRGLIRSLSCVTLALICLLGFAAPAFCDAGEDGADRPAILVDPVGRPDSCCAVLYDNTNGLPTSEANAIAETSDGFIWIGSYSGLVRYDGNSFVRMNSSTGIANVVCLLVDSRERLWIGTNDGGVAVMELGKFRMWNTADGLPSPKTCDIAESGDGTIYVGTAEGIVTIDEDMEVHPLTDPQIAGLYVESLRTGSDGKIYGVSSLDDMFVLSGGELEFFVRSGDSPIGGITQLLPDPENPGCVFLTTDNAELVYCRLSESLQPLRIESISPMTSVIDLRQIDGRLWICARNGIAVLDADGFHLLDELPLKSSVCHVMADYEGNLWFTSTRQGVMKLVPNRFSDVFERWELPETVVNSTCMLDGQLFVATDTGLIVLDENGPLSELPLTEAKTASGRDLGVSDLLAYLRDVRIRSVIRDSRDHLWISTWRSDGLLRYERGKITAFGMDEGLLSDHIRAVCEREDGSVLVVNSGGVNVIEGDRVVAGYGRADGILNTESLSVSYAENGDILLGSNGGGIYVINAEGVRCIDTEEGLSSGIVMRIRRDPLRGVYWLVTSNAIAYMDEDYQVTTVRSFPYSNNFDLYESSTGDMWVLSSNGIYVLPTEDLLADRAENPVHYGLGNGMPCTATSNSYSALTENGDLYIAGNKGVVKVNIDSPMEIVNDLKASVPFLDADGERLYADASGSFNLSPYVHKVTVYSYVFNYSLSDPQVSYRLEGFDPDFVTVSRRDLAPVDYTNLPGGTYHFVMELQDSQRLDSKTVSIRIVKAKRLLEQPAFYTMVSLVSILALVAGIRVYINKKTQMMELKNREAIKQTQLNTELKMANQIQASMLPHEFPPFPDRTEFDVYGSMDPAREVGGDFFDYFLIDEDHLCLVIADVSGKGIPASLYMMISKVIVQSCAMLGRSAADILTKTNEALSSNNQMEMFVTVWVGILEISTGKVTAANAGHEYPALMQNGRFELLKDKHGFVIGGMEGLRYKEYELQLRPGDKIFVYTDGVPEATDAENRMFGTDRMLVALNTAPQGTPKEILSRVSSAVESFVNGAEQFDDMTMLCLEYKGPADTPAEKA